MSSHKNKVESLLPLTSLRFAAAMMIVLLHAKSYFSWPWLAHAPAAMLHGVSFFFVLSGFILTHVYTSKPFPGYGQFIRARLARLWPVHILALLMLVIFVRADSITFDGHGIFSKWFELALNLTLTQSLSPYISNFFAWNTVSWSISTEVGFYLVFPLLLPHIERRWPRILLFSAIATIVAYAGLHLIGLPAGGDIQVISVGSATYANPLVRGFEFCLGMATWVIWSRYLKHARFSYAVWTAIEAALVLAVAAWLFRVLPMARENIHPYWLGILIDRSGSCWLFAILIGVLASGRGAISRMLSWRPFVFLGEISFSMYMLHMILMKMFFTWNQTATLSPEAFMGALVFVSAASFVLVEKPAQRFLMRKRAPAASSAERVARIGA
jgi:peptidoglycan/LPS O-acetylase OafA/YrhL